MFRRNLIVVYKPIKSSSILLSESNHRLLNLSDVGTSCLNLMNNRTDFYCSWLPYGSGQNTVRDTEIGISALVAEAIGLYDGCIVSCKVIEEVPVLDVVYVSAVDQKDWEMLEVSGYRIQSTLLDQTKIVNKNQKLVIWVNKSVHITVKIDKLNPDLKYGKIENNTEVIVSPFKSSSRRPSETNVVITDQDDVQSEIFSRRSDVEEEVIEAVPVRDTNSRGNLNGIKTVTTDDLDKLSLTERLALRREAAKNGASKSPRPTRRAASPKPYDKPEKRIPKKTTSPLPKRKTSPLPKRKSSPPRQKPSGRVSPAPIITLPSDTEDASSSNESSDDTTSNDASSVSPSHVSVSQSVKFDIQYRLFKNMKNELQEQHKKNYEFRAIATKWSGDMQMSDIFVSPHNKPDWLDLRQTYVIQCLVNSDSDDRSSDDRVLKEFYVKVKLKPETEDTPKNIYPTVEVNDLLITHLNLRKIDRLTLVPKKTALNFIEKIELYPSNYNGHDLESIVDAFKRLFISSSRLYPILINQDQIFKLFDGGVIVSVKIYPETFRYCLCDSEILRENKIFGTEQVKDVSATIQTAEKIWDLAADDKDELFDGVDDKHLVELDMFEKIIEEYTQDTILNLCLDERNKFRKMSNSIIVGAQTTGKSSICKQILNKLEQPPYYCHFEVFQCAQSKGRKIESIQQNLRSMLSRCIEYAPSILILDNLDTLAHSAMEHTQDNEYYNRVADIMQHMIMDYANRNPITVIATITNKNNLNKRLYTSRGRHLFQKLYKIPELEKEDRKKIITKLCHNDQIKLEEINYYKFSILTEGYTVGYLLQFVERAIFYAHKNNNETPALTNETLLESLKTTNSYCLQGIENNLKMDVIDDDDDDDETVKMMDKFPGLEGVVGVFEEILIWPTKYPKVFERSPLRNQAGILLFGPPGTGKTFLVSQLARIWNLRMISVKGPELLAKFIGQSEENVRNLFERARSAKPCVLFFDEFDSLAARRGHDSTGVTDRVVNQLLTELDGVEGLQGVVVIAATSRPELLDPALLRSGRIDRLVECSLPSRAARLKIFNRIAKTSSLQLDNTVDFTYFCDGKTDNYTGADIQSIIVSANMIAVKECLKLDPDNIPDEIFISQTHLLDAFKTTRPSLSSEDIRKYGHMYARFMNKEKTTARDFVAKRATLA